MHLVRLRASAMNRVGGGRLVGAVVCRSVSVTAMPSEVLVGAARRHGRAVPIGGCGQALIGARIELGWNRRHC
jgi:hypothetical protein